MTHICVSDLTSIGSDNGLSPGRRQAIIRTNVGILLIRPLGTNFSEFLVEILIFSFKKMRLKVSSAKRRPFCLGLNELTVRARMSFRINATEYMVACLLLTVDWNHARHVLLFTYTKYNTQTHCIDMWLIDTYDLSKQTWIWNKNLKPLVDFCQITVSFFTTFHNECNISLWN